VAPDVNVVRTKVTCLSRKGPRVCTCCPGRSPPSCADGPVALNPDGFVGTCSGCTPSSLGANGLDNGVPVYNITRDAKPGRCYTTSFTLVPSAEETLVQSALRPRVTAASQSVAIPARNVCMQLSGPKQVTVQLNNGATQLRQAWTVVVCWTPKTQADIPLGGLNQLGEPDGISTCLRNTRSPSNPFPFGSFILMGMAAGQTNSQVRPNTNGFDTIEDTLWPKQCPVRLSCCAGEECGCRVGCCVRATRCRTIATPTGVVTSTVLRDAAGSAQERRLQLQRARADALAGRAASASDRQLVATQPGAAGSTGAARGDTRQMVAKLLDAVATVLERVASSSK